MSLDPKTLLYAPTHEWVHVETGPGGQKIATVGISDFAIHALTDLVHIDLPQAGRQVKAGAPFGEVESVKAVSDLYSPVDGEVVEVDSAVAQNLESLTKDPFGSWLVKIRISDEASLSKLLDYTAYQKQCEQEMSES
jgi:glycine cleavage system H protein